MLAFFQKFVRLDTAMFVSNLPSVLFAIQNITEIYQKNI